MNNIPPAKWLAVWFVCAVAFFGMVKCGKALTPSEREIVAQAQAKIVDLRASYSTIDTENLCCRNAHRRIHLPRRGCLYRLQNLNL
jgi:hypothetical protein